AMLAVELAYDRRIAVMFVAAAAAVFVLLRLVAALIILTAPPPPRPRSPIVPLPLPNNPPPPAPSPSGVPSPRPALAVPVTALAVDGNLPRQFLAALPDKAPSFYFVDIPDADAETFDVFIRARVPRAMLERVPMLRGRIVAANGVPATDLKPPPDATWALQSDRGITYGDKIPAGSRLVEGEWWAPPSQSPAAGLVRETHRGWARPQARRPGHRQRARPQPHRDSRQSARGRLAEPRHQFRHGIFARHLPRCAAQSYRHPHVSRRQHDRRG